MDLWIMRCVDCAKAGVWIEIARNTLRDEKTKSLLLVGMGVWMGKTDVQDVWGCRWIGSGSVIQEPKDPRSIDGARLHP